MAEFKLKKISPHHSPELLELFLACEDYFKMAENKAPDSQTIHEFFEGFPATHSQKEKYSFGIYMGERLVGAIDLLQHFAVPNQWMIGLLLIHPDCRKNGWGKSIHLEIIAFVQQHEGESLRVGVVTQNSVGISFWTSLGYFETKRTNPIKFGNKESVVIIMEMDIK